MKGFKIITATGTEIHFDLYLTEAPATSAAFFDTLPFKRIFYHARVSGEEIWIDDMPAVDIIQENASVYTLPGEAVLGPMTPARTKTSGCFGIYYGDGKGLDAANIFAKVIAADAEKLRELGMAIWKNGALEMTVDKLLPP
jgi:hypothetical protein